MSVIDSRGRVHDTFREQRTAKDPAAYVAEFADFTWAGLRWDVRLIEVLPGTTKSGRRRFIIEFSPIAAQEIQS